MGNGGPIRIAYQETHIDTGKVQHAEYAHIEVQAGEHTVYLRRCRSLQHQAMGFTGIRLEHAVADETKANAGEHR
ncbi:hypothetical protein D3C80_1465710 [compost metagenome]